MKYTLLISALLCATSTLATFDLQKAIDLAKAKSTIQVPAGTYTQPIRIKRGITLIGNGARLEVESNEPAILIDSYNTVTLEGLNIKSKAAPDREKSDTPYALLVDGGNVVLKDCHFEALGNRTSSPCAISAKDRAKVTISHCSFSGFDYTIQYWDKSEGLVEDSMIRNSGHCGITIGSGSEVVIQRNIITGSRYHAVRCTGGIISAESNLIIRNKNRGFYMGNKSVLGTISNNLIVDNATGINVYAHSKMEIHHNVILRSHYAGLALEDTTKLNLTSNIISENKNGVVGFSSEKGKAPSGSLKGSNLLFENESESETIKLSSKTVREDPRFEDPDRGNFKSNSPKMGLSNPEALQALWTKWKTVSARN